MPEEKFRSVTELYERLIPALRTKKREMQQEKFYYVTEQDIWECLCKTIWSTKHDLTLGEMVHDILNTESIRIYQEIRKKE